MSAKDLREALKDGEAFWKYWDALPGYALKYIAQSHIENILTLIEEERKAAIDEYINQEGRRGSVMSVSNPYPASLERDKARLDQYVCAEMIAASISNPDGTYTTKDFVARAKQLMAEVDKVQP